MNTLFSSWTLGLSPNPKISGKSTRWPWQKTIYRQLDEKIQTCVLMSFWEQACSTLNKLFAGYIFNSCLVFFLLHSCWSLIGAFKIYFVIILWTKGLVRHWPNLSSMLRLPKVSGVIWVISNPCAKPRCYSHWPKWNGGDKAII